VALNHSLFYIAIPRYRLYFQFECNDRRNENGTLRRCGKSEDRYFSDKVPVGVRPAKAKPESLSDRVGCALSTTMFKFSLYFSGPIFLLDNIQVWLKLNNSAALLLWGEQ
jgi:hypothetical protein